MIFTSDKRKYQKHTETLQLQFCKSALRVKRNTATPAVLGDTGKYPIEIRFKLNVLKYWIRLQTFPQPHKLKQTYNCLLELNNIGVETWLGKVDNIIKECSFHQGIHHAITDTGNFIKTCEIS